MCRLANCSRRINLVDHRPRPFYLEKERRRQCILSELPRRIPRTTPELARHRWPGRSSPISAACCRIRGLPFAIRELQQCAIEKNALGQPKPRSGNFATVYRGLRPDGSSLALRVFNRRAEQRRQRYEAVSDYLAGRAIASFVGFVYDEQGIRSGADGKLYPLVRMDWVPGVTLFEWARDACRSQRSAGLARGAETWAELSARPGRPSRRAWRLAAGQCAGR